MKGFLGRNSIALICNNDFAITFATSESRTMEQKYKTETLIAAGGWVVNEFKEVLWIFRLGVWDLPKGKVEKNENIKDCAIREVQEECGLNEISLGSKITETTHNYRLDGIEITKITHWYKMSVKGRPNLIPQLEENIDLSVWLAPQDFLKKLGSTYDNIHLVVNEAMK